jgi:hypothetical protein
VKRLKTMADVTQTPLQSSDVLTRLAGSISRFSQEVIDSAMTTLEDAPQGDFRRLPTPHELVTACQNAANAKTAVRETRWCGRCTYGVIQSGREFVRCECDCAFCNNSGFVVVKKNGELYDSRVDWREDVYAKRCPNGCRATGSEAA